MRQTVEERLLSLEKSVSRWKLSCIALGCLGVLVVVLGTTTSPPDVLTTRRLRIVNDKGQLVAGLGDLDGEASLILCNRNGKTLVSASATDRGGSIVVSGNDKNADDGMIFDVEPMKGGGGMAMVCGSKGKHGGFSSITAGADGGASVLVNNANKSGVFLTGGDKLGLISLFGPSRGDPAVSLGAGKDGGRIEIINPDGTPDWVAGTREK